MFTQIYLTRAGSRGKQQSRRSKESENTVVIETGANEEKLITDLRPYSHYDLAVTVFNSKGEGPPSEAVPFVTDEGGKNEKEGQTLAREEGRVPRLK